MRCPFCKSGNTDVIDSREVEGGESIRRRRECNSCSRRFTTYEKVDLADIIVIKRSGSREPFDRNKVLNGIMRACEKRSISLEQMEESADKIEKKIRGMGKKEINSKLIGDMVVKELLGLDMVAYIRFASVYYNFDSPEQFRKFILLLKQKEKSKKEKKGK